MKNISDMEYHRKTEEIVKIVCQKTQNTDPLFFRVLTNYYLMVMASMMRCNINTKDRGVIPVNMYAINLGNSGLGKGYATNILEEHVIDKFRDKFLNETFNIIADINIAKVAVDRSKIKGSDPEDELSKAIKEFNAIGPLLFSFDSGTSPAVKSMRHKLLMAKAGSMNLFIDEIGSNLLGATDVLATFYELYDVGKVKNKLIKHTTENLRNEEIQGNTPTNMMLLGTPSKLLDGSKVEDELYTMLETGYARRCFFGYSDRSSSLKQLSPEEIYELTTDSTADATLERFSKEFENLADIGNFNMSINMSKKVTLLLIEYRVKCEKKASQLPDHDEMRKTEVEHRYFKAMKVAGGYAFIDRSSEVTEDHLYNAIKFTEESGEAFSRILTRERNYVKLAKFISTVEGEVTHADLVEDLPFYKGTENQKRELLNLAIAYGIKNNIVIKKSFVGGVEFLSGDSLKETDLNEMIVSYSTDWTEGYSNERVPFDSLHKLTQQSDYHWINHHLIEDK